MNDVPSQNLYDVAQYFLENSDKADCAEILRNRGADSMLPLLKALIAEFKRASVIADKHGGNQDMRLLMAATVLGTGVESAYEEIILHIGQPAYRALSIILMDRDYRLRLLAALLLLRAHVTDEMTLTIVYDVETSVDKNRPAETQRQDGLLLALLGLILANVNNEKH